MGPQLAQSSRGWAMTEVLIFAHKSPRFICIAAQLKLDVLGKQTARLLRLCLLTCRDSSRLKGKHASCACAQSHQLG